MALKPSEAAYVRGRCWAKIGDLDSGLLFLEEAIRLDPNAFHHWIQTLDLLAKLGRSSQVIELISALADRSGPIIRSVGRRPGLIRDNLTELYAKFHQEAAG